MNEKQKKNPSTKLLRPSSKRCIVRPLKQNNKANLNSYKVDNVSTRSSTKITTEKLISTGATSEKIDYIKSDENQSTPKKTTKTVFSRLY